MITAGPGSQGRQPRAHQRAADRRAHLWADRFDGSLADIFDLQDKVASTGAGVIEPAPQAAETARSANRPTNDLTAYDLYLRAYEMYFASAQLIPDALRLLSKRSNAIADEVIE